MKRVIALAVAFCLVLEPGMAFAQKGGGGRSSDGSSSSGGRSSSRWGGSSNGDISTDSRLGLP